MDTASATQNTSPLMPESWYLEYGGSAPSGVTCEHRIRWRICKCKGEYVWLCRSGCRAGQYLPIQKARNSSSEPEDTSSEEEEQPILRLLLRRGTGNCNPRRTGRSLCSSSRIFRTGSIKAGNSSCARAPHQKRKSHTGGVKTGGITSGDSELHRIQLPVVGNSFGCGYGRRIHRTD